LTRNDDLCRVSTFILLKIYSLSIGSAWREDLFYLRACSAQEIYDGILIIIVSDIYIRTYGHVYMYFKFSISPLLPYILIYMMIHKDINCYKRIFKEILYLKTSISRRESSHLIACNFEFWVWKGACMADVPAVTPPRRPVLRR